MRKPYSAAVAKGTQFAEQRTAWFVNHRLTLCFVTYQKALLGCYPAARAAALSGVPVSAMYDWAHKEIVIPAVSDQREMLWSYADLMALRIVVWLRSTEDDGQVRRTPMPHVRAAFNELANNNIDLWEDSRQPCGALFVQRTGQIVVRIGDDAMTLSGQGLIPDTLDLLGPFAAGGVIGPDLRRPRPLFRIVPGKCSGEPHVQATRLTSLTLASLFDRGYDLDGVAALYPEGPREALLQARDLERSLGKAA
jgi:uncharacterized protein (DUF433 family)